MTFQAIIALWIAIFRDTRVPKISFGDTTILQVLDVNTKKYRPAHAYCDRPTHHVYVNEQWWTQASDWQRMKVIFHEIAHENGLDHDFSRPNIMDQNIYTANSLNWNILVEDLKVHMGRADTH
jgi:hypothetical protein